MASVDAMIQMASMGQLPVSPEDSASPCGDTIRGLSGNDLDHVLAGLQRDLHIDRQHW
jgi:hypothetical protein